jgi:hypothetical protein
VPTYGFIREAAEDRFYERGGEPPLPPRVVLCPVCCEEVHDQPALATHLGNAHPLGAPRLLIDGELVVGERLIHTPLSGSRLAFANASTVLVSESGGPTMPWSTTAVRDALADADRVVLDLTLRNERAGDGAVATEKIRLRIEVPAASELEEVDEEFEEHLAVNRLDEHVLDVFADATSQFASAAGYASALHEYGVAVLLKDRLPGTSDAMEPAAAQDKYQRALEVVRHFPERRIARAVAGFARFNLNDFRSPLLATGIDVLDRCSEQLQQLAGQPRSSHPTDRTGGGPTRRCPTDSATAAILDCWAAATQDPVGSLDDLLARSRSPQTLDSDAVKCRALALQLALVDAGVDPLVAELAGPLRNDIVFGAWASQILNEAEVDDRTRH